MNFPGKEVQDTPLGVVARMKGAQAAHEPDMATELMKFEVHKGVRSGHSSDTIEHF